MATHAKLSPSAANRWMVCSGSIGLVDKLGLKDKTSKFAAEGTVAHQVGEDCLLQDVEPAHFLGDSITVDGFTFTVTENMIEAVKVYTDYIRNMLTDGIEMQVEVRCSLKSLGIEGLDGGTSDCVLIDQYNKRIAVIDYKHGQGVAVEAENNPQAMSYALGVLIALDIDDTDEWSVVNVIVQPRASHPLGPIRIEETTSTAIFKWSNEILQPAALATHEPDAKLVPSDKGCRFCLAAGQCPALYKKTSEIAIRDFDDILPEPLTMTAEQKISVMSHAGMIKTFLTAVENQIKTEMDNGSNEYEGEFKLVRKTTKRKFTEAALDPDFSPLLEYLTPDEMFIKKPRSIGDIERILKDWHGNMDAKEIMKTVTTKSEGAIVIAPLSDRRLTVQSSAISDFKDL